MILGFPVIAANDARCKYLFDNRYGTGQSTLTAIMQNTNLMVGGKRLVVLGYGWCGKGIARYASGLGARVSVCEVDPVRGLEAYADGFDVLPAIEAAEMGEIFVTATGSTDVLTSEHFERMRDGAILANAGGVDVEIDVEGLRRAWRQAPARCAATSRSSPRKVAGGSTSSGVAWWSTSRRATGIRSRSWTSPSPCKPSAPTASRTEHVSMENKVHLLPKEIDDEVARTKLDAVGMGVDALTPEQKEFLVAWREPD